MDEKGLGSRLHAARQAAGLTQQALCQRANLSYSTLAKIERGAIKSPSIFTIQNIAEALGVSLDTLLGGNQNANSPAPPAKAVSKSGLRFIYFDINGCLVHFFQGAFVKLAQDTGISADIIESTFWHFNDEACRGTISVEEFDRSVAAHLGVDRIDWQKYYFDALEPMSGMDDLVKWTAQHYYTGLMSNIMTGFIDIMKQNKMLPAVAYDAVIDSSVFGAIKPEPQIYEIAAQKAAPCAPHEILLIDDSRANLMAAEKMGWKVIWFDGYHPEESIARIKTALEIAKPEAA
jgi:transcriptional regulator with XRE-family HTH domain